MIGFLDSSEEGNDDMKVVETLAKSYTSEFRYTSNYISRHYNKNFSIIIYKNASCIKEQSLMMPTIDFQNCSKLIKKLRDLPLFLSGQCRICC